MDPDRCRARPDGDRGVASAADVPPRCPRRSRVRLRRSPRATRNPVVPLRALDPPRAGRLTCGDATRPRRGRRDDGRHGPADLARWCGGPTVAMQHHRRRRGRVRAVTTVATLGTSSLRVCNGHHPHVSGSRASAAEPSRFATGNLGVGQRHRGCSGGRRPGTSRQLDPRDPEHI